MTLALAVGIGVILGPAAVSTAASAAPVTRVIVKVTEAPFSGVAGARVVARAEGGRVIGRAIANQDGVAVLRLPRWVSPTRPAIIAATGGRYVPHRDRSGSRPFTGRLMAEVDAARPGQVISLSLATSAAVRLRDASGGSYRARLNRVRRTLGFAPVRLEAFADPLSTYSYAVGIGKLRRALRGAGGHDALIERIATAAATGKRVRGLKARKLTVPNVVNGHFASQRQPRVVGASTRQSSGAPSPGGPGGAPCTSTLASPPPPSLPSTSQDVESVINISLAMSEGLFQLGTTGDPVPLTSAIYGSVTGNAFGPQQQEVSTNELQTDLQAISSQLDCISNQISALQSAINALSLQVSLSTLADCEAAITSGFGTYQSAVSLVANGASPTSPAVRQSMSMAESGSIYSELLYACDGGLINQVLFSSSAGQTPAWPQLLKVATTGGFVASDSTALSAQTLESLQLFLQYWGTLEYQQAAMLNDIYNYQCTYLGEAELCAAGGEQSTLMGAAGCVGVAPTVNAIDPSAGASWCEWQQNIAAVWPGTLYADEIGQFGGVATTGNTISGEAWMAVPISLAYGSLQPWMSPGAKCETIDWGFEVETTCTGNAFSLSNYFSCPTTPCDQGYSFSTLASDALTFLEQQPPPAASAPETYYAPEAVQRTVVAYTGQPWSAGVAEILEGNLDAAATAYSPSPPTGSPSFGTTAFVGSGSVYNANADGPFSDGADTYTIDCGASWTGAPATNPGFTSSYQEAGYEAGSCEGPNAAVAVLLTRPWTQGTTWNPTPTIGTPTSMTSGGTTTVQLVAQGCPSGGCTWGITGALPVGVQFSQSTGQMTFPAKQAAFSADVIAANNYAISPAVALTFGGTS